jgi:alkanesulfonate monooxygenase SsuD/methylene tetrahydromethanopterin reductase-like flavin-dependent oxidoreductase (luciferase family)
VIEPQPFRLGFFTYLHSRGSQADAYAEAMEVFVATADLGFDVAWVAQHHFGHHGGLPSPFLFFAALAEKAPSLAVGTAVVTLPFEHPVRVAEDAAVFEAMFPGRLHLGVGTGIASPAVQETFDRAGAERRALYDAGLSRLVDAFAGKPLNADGDVLNPPAPALLHRIWESPASLQGAAAVGRRGNGLLLSRIAIGAGLTPTPEVQIPLVDLYLAELPAGVAPRIGLSRTVYPSRRSDAAFADLRAGLAEAAAASGRPDPTVGMTDGQRFAHNNIHFGTPEDVVASLRREPLLDRVTDLICQVQPGLPTLAQTLGAIELIATEVAPGLGWRSARAVAAVAGR